MHDLDRALQEFESDAVASYEYAHDPEAESYESESDFEGEQYDAEGESGFDGESYEAEADGESEYEGEGEYAPEQEGAYDGEGMFEAEAGYDGESETAAASPGDYEAVFDEIEEMEQAAALLEVQDEGELDHFLGGLISKVRKKLGSFLPPDVQRALANSLKNVARAALPKVGAAFGNLVAPGVGGAAGAGLAANAGKLFGLELEGMSHEDQEFEVARRVVGLGVEATKAAAASASGGPPTQTASDAVLQAAATHAPGLASAAARQGRPVGRSPRYGGGRMRSGRWFRRGHRIILLGA